MSCGSGWDEIPTKGLSKIAYDFTVNDSIDFFDDKGKLKEFSAEYAANVLGTTPQIVGKIVSMMLMDNEYEREIRDGKVFYKSKKKAEEL